jgi:hypothetical protein
MITVRGQAGYMVVLVVGMLLCLVLAVAVVGLVAIPARREGRDVLTPKGEEVVSRVRQRSGSALESARAKTGEVVGSAREKVADVTSPKQN